MCSFCRLALKSLMNFCKIANPATLWGYLSKVFWFMIIFRYFVYPHEEGISQNQSQNTIRTVVSAYFVYSVTNRKLH